MGPERRSDDVIQRDILQSFTRRDDLDARDIEIAVEQGEVTLGGTVESRDERWLAEDLVELVAGVSLVHNQLRIARP